MRPFCNKGWPYLHKFGSILPQVGVKGKHAYAPAFTDPAPLHSNDSDPKPMNENEMIAGWVDALQGGKGGSEMDTDGVSAVASTSKCSFSTASLNDLGSLATAPPLTIASHSEPPRKK